MHIDNYDEHNIHGGFSQATELLIIKKACHPYRNTCIKAQYICNQPQQLGHLLKWKLANTVNDTNILNIFHAAKFEIKIAHISESIVTDQYTMISGEEILTLFLSDWIIPLRALKKTSECLRKVWQASFFLQYFSFEKCNLVEDVHLIINVGISPGKSLLSMCG